MAVVWQSSQVGSDSGNTLTINKPTSTAAGDLLIAHIVVFSTSQGVTPPTGWTQVGSRVGGSFLFFLVAGSSEPSSYNFTTTASTTQTGAIHRITGASTMSPVNASAQGANLASTNTITLAGGITPSVPNTLLMAFSGEIANTTAPNGASIANNNPSWSTAAATSDSLLDQYGTYAPATTTGDAIATWVATEAANFFGFHLIAIAPPQVQTAFGATFAFATPSPAISKVVTSVMSAVFSIPAPTSFGLLVSKWNNAAKHVATWLNTPKS